MAKYALHIAPTVERQFLKLSHELQNRIEKKFFLLESDPRPHGSQKLHSTPFHRIRIGDYRVVYSINDSHKIITILDIGHRREVYRGL